ncbi:mechanosensitive ion channel family protein [Chloroflexota bacterium]
MQSIRRPLVILIVLEGIILALGSVSYLDSWNHALRITSVSVIITMVTYGTARIGGVLLVWYLRAQGFRRKAQVDEGLISFLRRIATILAYAIGLLVLLDYLNIAITPIITGLGIAGLAVALALQPTLSNFFASTQIVSDRVVRVGDFIELESSVSGYVTEVGWRSTRIRTVFNNIVTVPNSKLAESIITNYYGPTMDIGVKIEAGVSYSSDLAHVERVSLEVAGEVIEELDETIKTYAPWFWYEEFGDSNINLRIMVHARDRLSSFRVKSELIKRLHARFRKEGITINYPMRHLTFDEGASTKLPFLPDTTSTDLSENNR